MEQENKFDSNLVYPSEKKLFLIHAILSTIVWVIMAYFMKWIFLVYILVFLLFGMIAQSGLIAWLKGNGLKISATQLPLLYLQYEESCKILGISDKPDLYIINGGGILNAFATRFLRRNFVVLFSDVLDSMENDPESIKFYLGHELGHVSRHHILKHAYILPSSWLPLIGNGYFRACEYTCDRFGRAVTPNMQSAAKALKLLVAGRHYNHINDDSYHEQLKETKGFWTSLNELTSDYPWLVKRIATLQHVPSPGRSKLAYFFGAFIPRSFIPGASGLVMMPIMLIFIGFMAFSIINAKNKINSALSMPSETSADYAEELPNDVSSEEANAALAAMQEAAGGNAQNTEDATSTTSIPVDNSTKTSH